MTGPTAHPLRPAPRHIALALLACALVYWIGLNFRGLADSEGHRVVPGWELLESGHWAAPTMFGQVYLRKPPGIVWAHAAFGWLFGQNDYSARALSAASMTAAALIALLFGTRWFGRAGGLACGLAAALFPMFIAPGRVAEIESLNNMLTFASVLLITDLVIHPATWPRAFAAACSIAATGLVKGPAGLIVVLCAVPAACIAASSVRPLRNPRLILPFIISATVWAAWYILARRAVAASGQTPIVQGVSEFMWSGGGEAISRKLVKVIAMPFTALATAAPVSLAIGLPFLIPSSVDASRPARAISLTAIITLAILTIGGVGNPRYAQPAMLPLAMLAGFAVLHASRGHVLSRRLVLGRPWIWATVLAIACIGLGPVRDVTRSPNHSGKPAGFAIGDALPDGATIWADELIEARPEVLLYAKQRAAAAGKRIDPRWMPGFAASGKRPDSGQFVALRTDDKSGERAVSTTGLERIIEGRANNYTFTVYRVP